MNGAFGRNLRSILRGIALVLIGCGMFTALGGCAAHHIGTCGLYPSDIHTVYVPVFESDSFRRNLGERLTEAVVKQIETTTPYKVVSSSRADSVLSGRITSETKRIVVESPTDDGRRDEINFQVIVNWTDRRGELLQQAAAVPLPAAVVDVGQSATFIPEAGQSLVSAQNEAIERLAKQIVALMEQPW